MPSRNLLVTTLTAITSTNGRQKRLAHLRFWCAGYLVFKNTCIPISTMKNTLHLFCAVATLAFALPSHADQALATSKTCMACHSIDKKVVGPAFKDVAKKYAGDKNAAATLVMKITKGSTGSWGAVPMPANTQVNEADAKKLAAWVLSLK